MSLLKKVLLFIAIYGAPAQAVDFYVAVNGNDKNPGTIERPFATIFRAQKAVRQKKAQEKITVFLRDGTHYLTDTLTFTQEDSGTKNAPVLYKAYKEENPVISGGKRLQLKWTVYKNGIIKAKVPTGTIVDQLFVNGIRQHMARYPNYDPDAKYFNGFSSDAFSKERARRWSDPRGGFIHAMHRAHWGDFHYIITGKDPDGNVTYEGGWQNNRRMGMHKSHKFVENIFEELDAPGEWFLNTKENVLYFMPDKDMNIEKSLFETAGLRHLIEFRGSQENPVRFISIKGLTFRHTSRTFMDNKEPLLRSDWTIYRGGAIFVNGAEDCTIEDCFLDQVGSNAIFVNMYNRRITIRACKIYEAGANAICFVGDPNAVRSPLFEYHESQKVEDMDKTPGPKTDNYPADCLVDNCLLTRSGRFEKQTAGVQISMSMSITVRHCSVYDVPRAGINISEGTWGGHIIEFNDVFDTVKETGDHGSFNSWGRDRFWSPDYGYMERTNADDPNMPLWDVIKPVIIRNNRWRCDHGWDIDLDDGSTHYRLYNNLCLNGGIKNREGYYRLVENNIMVNNSFHPHVWFKKSGDVFRRNIVFKEYRPIRVPTPWGREIDYNFLHNAGKSGPATQLQAQSGRDENSIIGDALFVDPQKGDYRVCENSPVLKLGFKNFPMDKFGVQVPKLKNQARTPLMPDIMKRARTVSSKRDGRIHEWLGAKVKNITGIEEVSASGLSEEIGVVFMKVPKTSEASRAGLRQGDVILKLDGKPVSSIRELFRRYAATGSYHKPKLTIHRNQKEQVVPIRGSRSISLNAGIAEMIGEGKQPVFDEQSDFLGCWNNERISLKWKLPKIKPGLYEIAITLASTRNSAGSTYEIRIGRHAVKAKVPSTGGWENFITQSLGTLKIEDGMDQSLILKPIEKPGEAVMNIRQIQILAK